MKKFCALLLLISLLVFITACSGPVRREDLYDKTFQYEGEGAGSDFCIALHADGTVSYYEGIYSSHLGMGSWTLEGEILTITEEPETGFSSENLFRVEHDCLIFMEEGSTNFLYIQVSDGERFFLKNT